MRRNAGFTLLEMTVATVLFAAGSLYVYSTFTDITRSSRSATLQIDLGSENKRALTRIYNEIQATSLSPQDTDGLDSTDPEPVFEIATDTEAPGPHSAARLVARNATGEIATEGENLKLGSSREQARERTITQSRALRFRKVVGYQYNSSAGTIVPEWSDWISYRVTQKRKLARVVTGRKPRIVANDVDAFDVTALPDGTILLTLVTAKRNPAGAGWRRYANSVTVHPKN